MNRLIIWYNRNRKSIWKIIGVAIVAIVTLQLVQYIWKENKKRENQPTINTENISNTEANFNSITLQEDKSVISGDKITSGQASTLEVLDTFIDYCNNKKINEAYDLLSQDCKNEMYPKIENFKNSYWASVFSGYKKNISVENWTGNIYKVTYMEDALSTGVYQQTNNIRDFITITTDEEGKTKLNINNYVGRQDINKETEAYGIKIKAIEKNTYMDYEIYTFEVTNNSDSPILLNTRNNVDCMYLEDVNDLKYTAYTHELTEAELKLALKETKKIKIKYYNKYSSSRKINKIVFSKVILKYNAYINYQNPGYYKDYGTIQINL